MLTTIQTKLMTMLTGSIPKIKGVPLSIYLGFIIPYNDIFDNVNNLLKNLEGKITPVVTAAAAVVIGIIAIMWFVSEDTNRTAKRWLPRVIVGIIIGLSTATIIDTVKSLNNF